MSARRGAQRLTRLVTCYGCPAPLGTDNGPELSSVRLSAWRRPLGTGLPWTPPGKPTHNADAERCNAAARREPLAAQLFRSLAHVRQLVERWRHDGPPSSPTRLGM